MNMTWKEEKKSKVKHEVLYPDQKRPFMACHDVTEAYELSLSDMQISFFENHSEKVVIKTKHRL